MLSALKFCQGAVAKKDFLPALTNFVIEHGRIRAFNGTLALCSPIPFDINCKPKASSLIRAIANCEETVQMSMTPAGKLSIKSGSFKAYVECIDGETVHALPEGRTVNFDGEVLIQGLSALAPLIGTDMSRQWSHGILWKDQCLFVTCNVMAAQHYLGFDLVAPINIPRMAVDELVRIGEAPTHAQLTDTSITFHYDNGRWLRTQLLTKEGWPDIHALLDRGENMKPIQGGLFKALSVVKPFMDKLELIYFTQYGIRTSAFEGEGAEYDVSGMTADGIYNHTMLTRLEGLATHINWTTYPGPAFWKGKRVRGAIIGARP